MSVFSPSPIRIVLLSALLFLTACGDAEERAEARYQSGLALIEDGDLDRAIVEMRSVFQLNPNHLEARRTLAHLLLTHRNNLQGAYSQYLRLAEQYPDDLDTRITLSELAFSINNWDEIERHGAKAQELAPENPRVQAIKAARDYRAAVLDENNAARRDLARRLETLLEDQPDNIVLRSVLIDNALRENELSKALVDIDWLVEREPNNARYWQQRLNILVQLQDFDAVEDQLKDMVTRFAEDDAHKATLIRFYLSRQDTDKAEAFLRELATTSDDVASQLDLIRFVTEIRGIEAARTEIAEIQTRRPDDIRLKIVGAGLDFTAGDQGKAIATLEAVLEGENTDLDLSGEARVALAQMLLQTGNEVGARARVEEALTEDPNNVGALKMRAAWLIEADDTDAAISALRIALDNQSEDADAMTLMAQAYQRSGRQELANDFLALAVDASGNAPAESIRYARVLIQDERYLPAEDILLPALRLAPQNPDLLVTLGQLYLGMDDLGRVEQVAQTLRNLGTDGAIQAGNALDAERINRQSGPNDAISFLEGIAGSESASLASRISLIQARLRAGDTAQALGLVRDLANQNPGNLSLKGALASIEALNGNLETANTLYREILSASPQQPRVWLELSRLQARMGDPVAAERVIEEGIQETPEDPTLQWAKASYAERNGDIDQAIAIYEDLYARNSGSIVIANNLASLLSTYKSDADSLERAWTIARRLRNTQVPALQDTYGWITHRRGNSEDALPYLESAASNLPEDPLVQYHLAETYRALGQTEKALATYRIVLAIAGDADTRAQIIDARTQIAALENANTPAGD